MSSDRPGKPASVPPRRSQVSLATVFTVCFGVALAAALVLFLLKTRVALLLTLGGAIAAVAMDHAVEALARRGLRRPWAIAAVLCGLLVVWLALGFLLVPPIVSQARALTAEAPALWRKLHDTPLFASLDSRFHFLEQLRESVPGAATAVSTAVGGIVSALGGILAFVFLAVFMLVFGRDLAATFFAEVVSPASRERAERIASNIYRAMGGYLGGLLGICVINGTLTTVLLVILRTPFFLPLGILSGSSSLVPYAGPLVSGATVTLFVLVTGGGWKALAAAIYFVLYGQLEGNVLAPLIYRRAVDVNPLVTLLAILFLAEFMGIAGAILAVPVAAAAQIVMRELLLLRRTGGKRGAPSAPPDP
ncbi:AI-2E family transporter [Anaeromyxobacter oryzae]|uniref:AI-2E family transporter n=1 Tax=Anaeromyxobacter oryzae TaxID=2918170 RepID=A0ABN6MYW5_9BACT|nr:AI-2E family transporter [Anaeromyxobacter oryzae]BDG04753.1 AI-2E family transporter [Anaeromyxobacter oryzae]